MAKYYVGGYTPPVGVDSAGAVLALQRTLNENGASLQQDGVWGPKSQRAYEDYIASYGAPGAQITEETPQAVDSGYTYQSAYDSQGFQSALGAYERAAQLAQDRARYEAQLSIGSEQAKKGQYAQDFKDANTQRYASYMQAINPYGSMLTGLYDRGFAGSGVSESMLIGAGNAYGSDIAANRRAYEAAIRGVEDNIERYRLTGEMQALDAALGYEKMAADLRLKAEEIERDMRLAYDKLTQDQREFDANLAYKQAQQVAKAGGITSGTSSARSGAVSGSAAPSSGKSASTKNTSAKAAAPQTSSASGVQENGAGYINARATVQAMGEQGHIEQIRPFLRVQYEAGKITKAQMEVLIKAYA